MESEWLIGLLPLSLPDGNAIVTPPRQKKGRRSAPFSQWIRETANQVPRQDDGAYLATVELHVQFTV